MSMCIKEDVMAKSYLTQIQKLDKKIGNLQSKRKAFLQRWTKAKAPWAIGDVIYMPASMGFAKLVKIVKIQPLRRDKGYCWLIIGTIVRQDGKDGIRTQSFTVDL